MKHLLSDTHYLGYEPFETTGLGLFLTWRGLDGLTRQHTPLIILVRFAFFLNNGAAWALGIRMRCDTRSNSVLLALPSICILLTSIGPNYRLGVLVIAWHGAYEWRRRHGWKSEL